MTTDIRWKQRFQNFERAYRALQRSLEIGSPSEVERGGIIQFFELSFELSWKTMKDYLEEQGFQIKSPRDTIKQAFQSELISDGTLWIEALEKRNLTTHIYDEKTAEKILGLIKNSYFPIIHSLFETFKKLS